MASRHINLGANPLPLTLLAQAIPLLTRHDLEGLTERLIEYLDDQDGDLDIEPNGDELDGSRGEDDFYPHNCSHIEVGPGCPVSDPDRAIDDGPCDEPNQDLEPDEELTPDWSIDQTQALPDQMVIGADRLNMADHRRRIQRTRCLPRYRRDYRTGQWAPSRSEFFLLREPTVPSRRQLLRRKRGVPRRPRG